MPHDPAIAEPSPPPRLIRLMIPAAIFLLTCVAFRPVLDNGFVSIDDKGVLLDNTGYRGLAPENIAWMFKAYVMAHWQPLTWLSYAIDYKLAGDRLDPAQIHATSLLLHAANAVLLYFVALRLFRSAGLPAGVAARLFAAAGSLLWAIHPLRVESVAWTTERRDVLSLFFLFSALLAYLRAFPVESVRPRSTGAYIASIALLGLSLLSKAWGMTFFAVVTIIDWYPLRRFPPSLTRWLEREPRIVLLQKVPYVLLALGSAHQASQALKAVGSALPFDDWPLWSRIVQACYGLVWYIAKTFWPTSLAPLYDLPRGLDPWAPQYVVCYLLVAAAALALVLMRRRFPAATAAFAAYVVIVAPVLGFMQAGDQFVADRYAYVSTVPLYIAVAGGFFALSLRWRSIRRWAAVVVPLVAALMVLSWRQSRVWKDSRTLWRSAAIMRPDRGMSYLNYGVCLAEEGDLQGALAQYRIAVQLQPRSGQAWLVIATTLREQRDTAGAEAAYRELARFHKQAYIPLVGLGNLLRGVGREDEAVEAFREAVGSVESIRQPGYRSGLPYLCLGVELARRGDTAGARQAFEEAMAYPNCREQALSHLAQLQAH